MTHPRHDTLAAGPPSRAWPASSSASICRAAPPRPSPARRRSSARRGARRSRPTPSCASAADDTVTVLIKHIEFGQGPFTGPLHPRRRGAGRRLVQGAGRACARQSSSSTPTSPSACRAPAARPRSPIPTSRCARPAPRRAPCWSQAAAQAWNVPAGEITVERGVLRHARSERQGRFGQFAEAAAQLPVPENVPLKDPAKFRLIGREGAVKKLDSAAKSERQGAVHHRHPRAGHADGGRRAPAALRRQGRRASMRQMRSPFRAWSTSSRCPPASPSMPTACGRRSRAARSCTVTWDEADAEKRSSEQLIEEYRALARQPGTVAGTHGDAEAALARADKVIEAEFVFPYLAHAPMEPLDGYPALGRRAGAWRASAASSRPPSTRPSPPCSA